jgi:hypothetical protein
VYEKLISKSDTINEDEMRRELSKNFERKEKCIKSFGMET